MVGRQLFFELAAIEEFGGRDALRVADDDPIDGVAEGIDGLADVFHVGNFVDGKDQDGRPGLRLGREFREIDLGHGRQDDFVHVGLRVDHRHWNVRDFAQDFNDVCLRFAARFDQRHGLWKGAT